MSEQAHKKLNRALLRLAETYTMYTHHLSLRSFQADASIPTMSVARREGAIHYRYNPAFILRISDEELLGVLHHEVNHIEFGHVLAKQDEFPDHRARTIAEEVTVNEYVPESLPGTPLTLEQFPQLPPGEDTVTRYKRLEGKTGEHKWVDHLPFFDLWRGPSPEETEMGQDLCLSWLRRARLPDKLRQRLTSIYPMAAESLGLEPMTTSSKPIAWNALLRRVGIELGPRPVFHRPSRRFPDRVGSIPGTSVLGRPRVLAAIDTSASMEQEALGRIGQELGRLARESEVTVVECDDEIRATYRFRGPLSCVRGRGGTDLRPPLSSECIGKVRPDVVVYFTDGAGTAPERPPATSVIWALTPGGEKPVPWGEVIRL